MSPHACGCRRCAAPRGGAIRALGRPCGANVAMMELVAEQKFTCPACGGESVWNPAKQKMVCPFCGTESPVTLAAGGTIVEHDLVSALRGITDAQRGWMTEKRQVRCQSCNAISVLDPARQAQNCEFCG